MKIELTEDGITVTADSIRAAKKMLRAAKIRAETEAKDRRIRGDAAVDLAYANIGRLACGSLGTIEVLTTEHPSFANYLRAVNEAGEDRARIDTERGWASVPSRGGHSVIAVALSGNGYVVALKTDIGDGPAWFAIGAEGDEWHSVRIPLDLAARLERKA